MKPASDAKAQGQRKTVRLERSLLLMFILVALIASAGLTLTTIQERNRIRLVAEYQAYQFATVLMQDVQANMGMGFQEIDGLLGFGIYTIDGEALFKMKSAPARVMNSDLSDRVDIGNDKVRLLMIIGGNAPPIGARMRRVDAPSRGMTGNSIAGRYLFIEYAAPAIKHGNQSIRNRSHTGRNATSGESCRSNSRSHDPGKAIGIVWIDDSMSKKPFLSRIPRLRR